MRIEATDGNEHKVWLTDSEIEDLRRATNSQRDDLIISSVRSLACAPLRFHKCDPLTSSKLRADSTGFASKPGKIPAATVESLVMLSSPPTLSAISSASRTNTTSHPRTPLSI